MKSRREKEKEKRFKKLWKRYTEEANVKRFVLYPLAFLASIVITYILSKYTFHLLLWFSETTGLLYGDGVKSLRASGVLVPMMATAMSFRGVFLAIKVLIDSIVDRDSASTQNDLVNKHLEDYCKKVIRK